MQKTNINYNGFTLLELLVALTISSLIMIGCYVLISTITNSNTKLSSVNREHLLYYKLHRLFTDDIFSSSDNEIIIEEVNGYKIYSFKTYNSVFFQSAFQVTVKYYLKQNKLIREEINRDLDIDNIMVLLRNVSSFKILSFNGSEYIENNLNNKLIKIIVVYDNKNMQFIIGKI